MNKLQNNINQLPDYNVIRLAVWVFDEVREQIGGDLAIATMKELNSDNIFSYFKKTENTSINEYSNSTIIIDALRDSLFDLSESNSEIIENMIEELGMEAGWGTEIATLVQEIGINNLILIIVILKLNFKLKSNTFKFDRKMKKLIIKEEVIETDKNITEKIIEIIKQFSNHKQQ